MPSDTSKLCERSDRPKVTVCWRLNPAGWRVQPWNWQIAQSWFPANIVFVGMLWTSFPALQLLGVGMVTVLKNLTNLFTIFGDIVLYNKSYSKGPPLFPPGTCHCWEYWVTGGAG